MVDIPPYGRCMSASFINIAKTKSLIMKSEEWIVCIIVFIPTKLVFGSAQVSQLPTLIVLITILFAINGSLQIKQLPFLIKVVVL